MGLKSVVGDLVWTLFFLWNVCDCVKTHQDANTGESSCQANTWCIVSSICAAAVLNHWFAVVEEPVMDEWVVSFYWYVHALI